MEKENTNTFNFEQLPPEILLLVFNNVKAADVLPCELVCKSWHDLFSNNDVLWKEKAQREFDLSVNSKDTIKQAKKFAKINNNIHKCRCVSTVLAVSTMTLSKNFHLGYCSYNDQNVAVNWIQKRGSGSGEFDYSAHAGMIDTKTRRVKTILPASDTNIALHGPYLTQMVWNGYHVVLSYNATKHAQINAKGHIVTEGDIPPSQTIVYNEDKTMQHLLALPIFDLRVGLKDNDLSPLKVLIYDLQNKKPRCEIKLDMFASRDYYYLVKPSVVFKGDKIYALQHEGAKKLTIVDINKPKEHHVIDMSALPDKAVLTGVTETFVFGQVTSTKVWCYNLKTKTVAMYNGHNDRNLFDVKWYCGTLMVFESYAVVFLDPFTQGPELTVISTLAMDRIGNVSSRINEDGKVFLSSIYTSVKMLDFAHVNDNVQLLAITGDTKDDMTPHNIKAYQMYKKMKDLFGAANFISRYLNEGNNERFGIFFTEMKSGPKLPINVKHITLDPEYHSPYFTMDMTPGYNAGAGNPGNYIVPKTMTSLHKIVVLFYERFDGENWRLSVPSDWSEGLKLLFGDGDSKCLVQ